jgi:transcriptional regulator with XRE-family HTH domain
MDAGTTYSAIIGNVIKQLRDTQSITQGGLAEKMGVSQAAWSKLESGKSTLSTAQLAKVADLLKVPANQIMQYADKAAANFKAEGLAVAYDSKEAESIGLMLLGAAAIGALIAAVVISKK